MSSLPPPARKRRLTFYWVWGAITVFVLWLGREVLLPFALAVVLAYVFDPLVERMTRLQRPKLSRAHAVILLYVSVLTLLGGFVSFAVPRLAAEVRTLSRAFPETLVEVRDEWLPGFLAQVEAAIGAPEVVPPAEVSGQSEIRLRPTADGGFALELPPQGIQVRRNEDGYDIFTSDHGESSRTLSESVLHAWNEFAESSSDSIRQVLRTAESVVRGVVKGVFSFFIVLMLSAYLLLTKDRIFLFFRSLWPLSEQASFALLLERMDRGLGGVVRGQLVIALVNGVLTGVGLAVLDVRYWPVLTLIATLLSVIPIFGAILSSVPAVLFAVQDGFYVAVATLLWIVLIHQIEANLLNPKIMGDAAKVHPVLVVFALLVGEVQFGIAGALLAVPVLSLTQSVFLHYREISIGRR